MPMEEVVVVVVVAMVKEIEATTAKDTAVSIVVFIPIGHNLAICRRSYSLPSTKVF